MPAFSNMIFFEKKYKTPSGSVYTLYNEMLKQPHLLIAGATGSGKSVVVNALIYTLLYRPPVDRAGGCYLALIDPKRVELAEYKDLPHCIGYGSEPDNMIQLLQGCMNECERRYKRMQKTGVRKYQGGDLYVIIDELADLITTNGKRVTPLIQRLAQIGRAANIHLIVCTQCPLASIIPTAIKVNFDARIALHTRSRQDSRNIIERAGCECLPRYGYGYYMRPEGIQLYRLPMVSDEARQTIEKWWRKQ